jgi:orotate phosphoribosyltransferase
MKQEQVLELFRSSGALLEGHFQLTSGYHSNRYFQCAKVLQYPAHTTALCGELAAQFDPNTIDVVIAPAMGGIIVAQEIGRQLNRRTLFSERKDGMMQLRRGFEIAMGERVLVCEDVVTTGGSVNEVIEIVKEMGGAVAGVAYMVDRSNGTVRFAVDAGGKQVPLMVMDVVKYDPAACPLCAQGLPLVKPGSRPGK